MIDAYTDTSAHTLAVLDAPNAAKTLKAELPAITATKEEGTKWVKSLDAEDAKEWKPAFDKLQLFHPLLALKWQEQCDPVTTDSGRWRLFRLAGRTDRYLRPDDTYPNSTLEPHEKGGLTFTFDGGRDGRHIVSAIPGTLTALNPPHWQRARIAIILLERMKTDDAKAVLKQLADGHPDILPTKEAKAALERLK